MKSFKLIFNCSLCLQLLLLPSFSVSQSSVIRLPDQSLNGTAAPIKKQWPPSSLTPIQRNWEAILFSHCPQIDSRQKSTEKLLRELQDVGLPFHLDQTARDDNLMEDDWIQLGMPGQLLIHRLSYALREKNASIAILGDQLMIISLDVATDPEFFSTLVYDISRIGMSSQQLANTIRTSVVPDDWDDSNGDNSIQIDIVNGRKLMTLSAPYPDHLKVRRLLSGFFTLSGSHHGLAVNFTDWQSRNSTAIEVPGATTNKYSRRRRNRNLGGGGFGGGGGVF